MRILHTETSPNWGGQEMRILEQVRWLNEHGHESWIAARKDSAILQNARSLGLPHVDIPFRGSASPSAIFALLATTRRLAIDVVDCHSARDAVHGTFLRFFGRTVVRTLHVEIMKWRKPLHRWVWKNGSNRIIVVSGILKSRLQEKGCPPDSIDVVSEGIDLAEFDCKRDGSHVRTEFGIGPEEKLITNIGMLRPDKGQTHFIDAADIVMAAVPNARFLIVGAATRPEFERAIRARINASRHRDRFILCGYRSDVAACIAASDCIVVSSLQEAHSRVIPQAFAMKRPVLATSVGGIPEIVRPGETGTLVPPADPAAMGQAIVSMLGDDDRSCTERAYRIALSCFSRDDMMRKTLESYERAMHAQVSRWTHPGQART